MTKSSPLPQDEADERLSVLFGHSIPHTNSWRRSFAATNRWLRRSRRAKQRQSRGEIQAVPGYGIPRAGRNKGGLAFLRDPMESGEIGAASNCGTHGVRGNRRGFRPRVISLTLRPGEIGAAFARGRFLSPWGRGK